MLFSTFVIQNLNFGVVFSEKYRSDDHKHHMRMAQLLFFEMSWRLTESGEGWGGKHLFKYDSKDGGNKRP